MANPSPKRPASSVGAGLPANEAPAVEAGEYLNPGANDDPEAPGAVVVPPSQPTPTPVPEAPIATDAAPTLPAVAPGQVAVVARVTQNHDDRRYRAGDVFMVSAAAAARLIDSGAVESV